MLAAFLGVMASGTDARAQSVDWLLSIDDTGFDPIPAGGTIDYAVNIDNNGFDSAPATTVSFDVPAGTSLTGLSGDLTNCSPASGAGPFTFTCDVPPLASLQQVTQIVQITTTAQGVVTFSGSIPTAGDILPANNDDDETTTVIAGADIGLTLVMPATAASGSMVDFVFEATNHGPDPSNGFTVEFPVPTGIANMTAPAGCVLSGTTYSCDIPGVVAVGDSVALTFSGQISGAGGSDITATGSVVGADPGDPVSANNTVNESLNVTAGTDMEITKERAPSGPLLTGDSVTFTLAAEYTGDSPNGITITDTIPDNYAITSVTPAPGSGWVCTVTGQDVECTLSGGSGAGADVSLGSVEIAADIITAGSPVNTATISATGPEDQDLSNNTATDGGASISDPVVDLRANKSGPVPALVVVGNSYDFDISTTNVGNTDFWGTIEMEDSIPAGLTVDSINANGWSCLPAAPQTGPVSIICSRLYTEAAPLADGATTPAVTFNTTVTAAGTISNGLHVSSPDANIEDLNSPNDTITYDVTSETGGDSADVGALKARTLAVLPVGEVQTYTLEITNAGPQPALDVEVEDNFLSLINSGSGPTGQGYIGHSINAFGATGLVCADNPSGGASRLLTCTIDVLPVCTPGVDCPTITVQVRPGGDAGARTNTFSAISQTTPDPDLTNNDDDVSFDVLARVDMTVTKNANPDPVAAGQNLTYVVAAQNLSNGLSTAENVTITDSLPADMTFISASGPNTTCTTTPVVGSVTGPGNDQVVCSMGDIGNGAQRSVSIVVRPNNALIGTIINNSVDVATTTTETDLSNNSANVDVEVEVPDTDILVNKVDSVDPLTIGEDTVYTVTVTNAGPSASQNVVVTDALPAALVTYQSHVVSGVGVCGTVPAVGSSGGTLECSWPFLAEGDSETIQVTMRGVGKGTVDNIVTISSDEIIGGWDRLAANNSTSQDTTLRTRTDLALTKTGPGGSVALLEDFNWLIDVEVNTGPGLAEADNVEVTDNLPANMELTGTPVAVVISGNATATACTGVAGAGSFSCDLGTVDAGSLVQITVPAQVTAVSANPQSFTNPASVSTSSYDQDMTNNSDDDVVSVVSSSIAGTVFRDFADDAAITGGDTGISGITMTLTGTDVDGNAVSRTVTTDSNGEYIFEFLPEGSYTITRGVVSEPYLSTGQNTAGSEGGATPSQDVINAIQLPAATDATEYLFAEIPQARIGISKDLQGSVSENADGSFTASFGLTVENFSLEELINIAVSDQLSGATPLFGTLASPADPVNDPLAEGTYAITAPPSGSCGGLNAGFDGSGDTGMAGGFALSAGSSCTIAFSIRVQPLNPVPAGYENQAEVEGEGALSGQTSATNPQLSDLSDDGANPDADGDGQGNEAGENDPTPLAPVYTPAIALVKTSTITGASSPIQPGDEISYAFEVTNTGNVTLTGITLTDILPGIVLSGGPIASLAPGASDSTTFTATYSLTQADIDAGEVENQATTAGTDPFGTVVTDDSGTTTGDDDALITPILREPAIALIKTADPSGVSSPALPGDEISYAFEVTNTGNVTLTGITLTDILPGIVLSGGPIVSLAPGASDSTTFTATYTLTQDDVDAGEVENQATASGTGPSGAVVADDSGATNGDDDATIVPLTRAPAIALVKTADTSGLSSPAVAGDEISYAFEVTNTGNVTLSNVTLSDTLPGIVLSGGPIASLAPGASDGTTFTATYTLTQADIDAGEVVNQATASGTGPSGVIVTDDSGTTNGDDDATVVLLTPAPAIALVKSANTTALQSPPQAGDIISYSFAVTNTGNVTLANVTVSDDLPGIVLSGGPIASLAPGETDSTTITATYALTQDDVDAGEVENQATASGTDPFDTVVTDDSGTTNGDDDPLITPLTEAPSIALVKTADTSGLSSPAVAGDEISYAFEVTNTGNVTLTGITLSDTLPGIVLSGGPIASLAPGASDGTTFTATYTLTQADIDAGEVENHATATGTDPNGDDVTDDSGATNGDDDPTLVLLTPAPAIALVKSADDTALQSPPQAGDEISYSFAVTNTGNVTLSNITLSDTLPGIVLSGGPIASLAPGETDTDTFTATYQITLDDIVAGGVENSATATGTPPSGPDVNDLSGSDLTNDDPTLVPLTQAPSITLDKVADDSLLIDGSEVGDPLPYTFTVTNTGNMPLHNVTVTDALPGVVMSGGPIPVLNPGEVDSTTFTAIYHITEADITAGEVVNLATVTGAYGPNLGGTVTADDSETATVGNIEALPEIFPPFTTDGGTTTSMLESDLLNNGPATLDNVVITVIASDPGVTLDPATGLITLEPGHPAGEYTVEYEICSAIVATLCDTTVETVVQGPLPAIEVTKTQTFTDNGDGRDDVGDVVDYVITVVNTGNVPLSDVVLTDTLTDLSGAPLVLDAGPDFVNANQGSAEGSLEIGEVATYSASFTLTLQAVNAGGVRNSVLADAMPVFGPGVPGTPTPVSDVSDDGDDLDGNTEDDPTELALSPSVTSAGITLTKTTPVQIVQRGAIVPYTITISNNNPFVAGPMDLVDILPANFLYVPDSATLDGAAAVVEATAAGRITWPGISVPAMGTVTATVQARVLNGARAGRHVNTASLIDSVTGDPVVGPAAAVVRILPEAVFDCADVVGKVFEDHNGNGYQDMPGDGRAAGVSDQSYGADKYGGKLGVPPEPQAERGIPGVRLVAPDGTIITTDENGLYSVPCAALPADRGSNFILKLDTRSLPSGYRVTTENPRVMRLTPGMMSEMNFGAAIGRVARVDLNPAAFVSDVSGAARLTAGLASGIRGLVRQLAGEPVTIRLAFHVAAAADADDVKAARHLMELAEEQIRREWREVGRARLLVEKIIVRAGQ